MEQMTDRELLELAAKAGQQEIHWTLDGKCYRIENGLRFKWNPLADDGDALRLANALHLSICHTMAGIVGAHGTAMVGLSLWNNDSPLAAEKYGAKDDMHESTRRAIVRAAAAIGQSM